jgi:hypothetical protein
MLLIVKRKIGLHSIKGSVIDGLARAVGHFRLKVILLEFESPLRKFWF